MKQYKYTFLAQWSALVVAVAIQTKCETNISTSLWVLPLSSETTDFKSTPRNFVKINDDRHFRKKDAIDKVKIISKVEWRSLDLRTIK